MKNLSFIYFLSVLCFLSLGGCSKDGDKIETLIIASEQRLGLSPGGGSTYPHYIVKNTEADEWRFFSSYIEGFNYETGCEYVVEIKVHEDDLDPTLADQELFSYSLHKIISKEKKDSENLPENLEPKTDEI